MKDDKTLADYGVNAESAAKANLVIMLKKGAQKKAEEPAAPAAGGDAGGGGVSDSTEDK